ncbi:MAG: hypothetical protein WCI36_05080 [bacterium]
MYDILLKIKSIAFKCFARYPTVIVLLAFVVLTLAFTFPVVAHLSTEIPKGGGDVYQVISSIDVEVGQMKALAFPKNVVFLLKKMNVFAPYVLFNLFFDKFAAYNILFLLTYILSGLGMYLLAMYFCKNRAASFLAGIIYAFAPFHFYQSVSVHLGSMQQQWIPFLLLSLFQFFENFKLKHFLFLCFFAFMIAMAEHQMLAFSVLAIFMVAVYKIWVDRTILKNKKFWMYVVCSFGMLAMVAFFMFGDMLKVATSDNNFLDAGENAANRYSIKFLDPIAPPIFHSIWPGVSESVQSFVLGDLNRGSYFIGFSVLGVLIYFALLIKKRRLSEMSEKKYRQNVVFWSVLTLLFYLFSLGNSFSLGKITIYLPFYLIYKILPFYENIRTTGRMFVFVMIGVAMLFAYGFIQLLKKYPQKRSLLVAVFSVVIVLEFWVAPIGTMIVSYSPFYDQIAKDSEKYKILEIPGSTSYEFASYAMFTNSVHGKIALNGMPLARKIKGEFDMQQNTPVIKELLYTIAKGNDPEEKGVDDIISFDYATKSTDLLNYYGVKYVNISKLYADEDVVALAQKFIEKNIAYAKKYEDSWLISYEVAKKQSSGFYFQLDDATSELYSADFVGTSGNKNRELGDGASLKIVNMGVAAMKVNVKIRLNGIAGLKFFAKQYAESSIILDGTEQEYSFNVDIAPGINIVPFAVQDAQALPVAISNSKKKHQAAVVSNISVFSQN